MVHIWERVPSPPSSHRRGREGVGWGGGGGGGGGGNRTRSFAESAMIMCTGFNCIPCMHSQVYW